MSSKVRTGSKFTDLHPKIANMKQLQNSLLQENDHMPNTMVHSFIDYELTDRNRA